MRPGDRVRVKPTSDWCVAFGDAIGVVESVTEHTRYAWVVFDGIGVLDRVRWEELEPAGAAPRETAAAARGSGTGRFR